jgi:hypothetical protein
MAERIDSCPWNQFYWRSCVEIGRAVGPSATCCTASPFLGGICSLTEQCSGCTAHFRNDMGIYIAIGQSWSQGMEEAQHGLCRWRQVQTNWLAHRAFGDSNCRFDIPVRWDDPGRWRLLGGCSGGDEHFAANNCNGGNSVGNYLFLYRIWTSEYRPRDANVQQGNRQRLRRSLVDDEQPCLVGGMQENSIKQVRAG